MKPEEAIEILKEMQESYQDEIGKCSGLLDEQWKEYADVCNLAIQAIEKQVEKKVKNIRFSRDYELAEHNIMEGECPDCGETVTGSYLGNYCGSCGVALDWEWK